jgi:hypothetical protein
MKKLSISKIFSFIAGVEYLRKFLYKIQNGSHEILGPRETDSWKKPEAENLVSDSL